MSNLFFKSCTTVLRKIAVGQKNASSYALQLNLPCLAAKSVVATLMKFQNVLSIK